MSGQGYELETARATLDCARGDIDAEDDRMKVLDGKLSTIASFSGLSVSISASLGASVLTSGKLNTGFTISLGVALVFAVAMLLLATLASFRGLRPKEYKGITLEAAEARVTPRRLRLEPAEALAILASTYYTRMLPAARTANGVKLDKVVEAFRYARLGLMGLVLAVVLTAIGSVTGKGESGREPRGWSPENRPAPISTPKSRPPGSTGSDGVHREGVDGGRQRDEA